jgi:hypothetical protein
MRHRIQVTLAIALAMVTALRFLSGPDPAAAPTLIAAYNFNEGSGSVLNDVTGNGNHGTLANGPVWTTAGKYGGALTFDGSNDIVNIPHSSSLNLTTGLTLEAWVRPTTVTNWRTVLMKERPGNLAYGLYANTSTNRPAVELATAGGAGNLEAAGTGRLNANTWAHVAATFDGSSLKLYVNGTQVRSLAASGTIVTSTNALRIGGNTIWGEYFRGQIDDVRIYNEALTATQIQADMNTPVAAGGADTTPPAVNVTAPANGSTVGGTVTVTANAFDNVGVSGVRFTLDGANIGAEDTSAPYSVTWNTTTAANGSHNLAAVARDAAGNTTGSAVVTVTVNNFVDTTPPSVNITVPANGSTVSATVTVTATASDNVGVAGVRFTLDGANLGAEDTSAPYSVTWNTTTAANGSHNLGAVARDAAGNSTGSAVVTVTVNNFVDTTAPTVSITAPANGAQVAGTVAITAAASDDVGVVGVQFKVDGVNVGAEDTTAPFSVNWNSTDASNGAHTVTAVARDAANNTATSAPVSVTTANTVNLGTLNGHTVAGDGSNKLISWLGPSDTAYETAVEIAWDFLLNRVPNDSHGLEAYYTHSYLHSGSLDPSGWENNPADKNAGVIESALYYYAYSGDERVITLARQMVDYHLDHGMTAASGAWPSVPYASGCGNCLVYDGSGSDGQGYIEPDKVGSLGLALLQLYHHTGDTRYRDAAIASANALAANVRTGNATASPWPFRVHAQSGEIKENYTAHVVAPIALLTELIRLNLGSVSEYQSAKGKALNWLMTYPMQNNVWANYFEDVGVQGGLANINNVSPMETAYYLMQHPEDDPNWQSHVAALIAWVENNLGAPQFGANAIKEQAVFPFVMGSHTARYAAVNALYSQLTGNTAAREKAYRAFNWATYMISSSPQGQIIDGPDVNNIWFSDGYTDFIKHFMRGMGSVPAWAPNGESHVIGSTSVVKSVTYGTGTIDYATAEERSVERLKVNFAPQEVTVNGVALSARTDLSAEGWVYDSGSGLLQIRHDAGTQVRVSNTTSAPDTVPPVISSVVASNIGSSSATISWTTNESADGQVAYGPSETYGQSSVLNPAMVTAHTQTLTGLTPGTLYHVAVTSRDAAGNSATSGDFVFTTATVDSTPPSVAITFPEQNGTVSGTVTVTADASDNTQGGVAGVQFKLNGVNVGSEDSTAPYSVQWNTSAVPNGSYSLTATARDNAGNTATSGIVTVTVSNVVDTTAPTVSMTAPSGGTVLGSVTLTADASDDTGVAGVQFLVDGVAVGAEDPFAPYTFMWDSTTVANGPHTLSARARDAAGNITTSSVVNVTVNNPQTTLVDFNSHPSQNANLNGQYPSGVIDWGTNTWFVSGPFGQFSTKSISFNRPGITSGTFTFVSPKRLVSVRVYNGGSGTTTLTFGCSGNPTRTVSVGANQVQTISMTWGVNCTTVTFTSSNGWDTNLDDFIFDVVQ